ncbi:hypothetical protein CHUAL_013009 [Chamberlinius hualienensis]
MPPISHNSSGAAAPPLSDNGGHYYDDAPAHGNEDIYGGSSSRRSTLLIPRWDVFREFPSEESHGPNERCYKAVLKAVKCVAYVLTFMLVLVTAVISKGTVLFMTSQIKQNRKTPFCKAPNSFPDKHYAVALDLEEQAQWLWALFFTFITPEVFTLVRSVRIILFKSIKKAQPSDFYLVCLFETLHTVGVAMLVFVALPELDAVKGAMLTNCICLVPAILCLLSRGINEEKRAVKVVMDILAILAQLTGLFVWPIVLSNQLNNGGTWAIPLGVLLTSFGWWENFVDGRSNIAVVMYLAQVKERLKKSRYFVYAFVSVWKAIVFFACMVGFVCLTSNQHYLDRFPFLEYFLTRRPRTLTVESANATARVVGLPEMDGSTSFLQAQLLSSDLETEVVSAVPNAALLTWTIQFLASYVCYVVGKFACRICIQGFSYAFPVNLTIPVTISLLIAACGMKNSNVCFLKDVIPRYLYWVCPNDDFLDSFISHDQAWIWLLWLLSQTWITLHIWTPKTERLANTEKLFVTPMYNGILIDQSMGMNRRRDEDQEVKTKDLDMEIGPEMGDGSPCYESISEHLDSNSDGTAIANTKVRSVDQITHIYACATMWHETEEEMIEMLKSVMSARKNAQKYLQIVDPDYYEYETHLFFDDAFEISDDNWNENVCNRFVKSLVRVIDEAAKKVHLCDIRLKPPLKIPTPYGGRLIWTLPGKTTLIAHLKDKSKIRHRKRWSQVMYMYYLLGHRLMDTDLDTARKEALASNTYILTLDGDIDFKPSAVQLLIDLMKKNKNLGAACGRIHPIGTGMMVWYQKFEYAIGHWLQKATEHMIGCVLCSPGCFSLFRAKALMDDNVMRRYTTKATEAHHYVQYDQGEDRWLCTLLLQRGYRVEYSAASDAYTHCPEGFNEFYNQRRRWVPSTMANIMDLLGDSRRTVKVNDNISTLYIIYQSMLMVGTILGPGTIFLMLVGAFVAAFKIDNWTSFYANIIPILFFMIVCFIAKSENQLLLAQILSAGYALVMMAVLVGISLQMREDGIGSPSFIFFVMLSGSFFIAAILHPQEFGCVIPGLLYYLSIPSMYLLLIIYSLINLNNVTWGTREIQAKKTKAEMEEEQRLGNEMKAKRKQQRYVLKLFGMKEENMEGGFAVSCANLCSFLCCTHPKPKDEQIQLMAIQNSLDKMLTRLELIEKSLDHHGFESGIRSQRGSTKRRSSNSFRSRSVQGDRDHLNTLAEEDLDTGDGFSTEMDSDSTDSIESPTRRDPLINPLWIEDKDFTGPMTHISDQEKIFWKDLIDKYLYPIDANKEEQTRITIDLKELRNKAVFAFFMFNALFILIVFLLQLNKDNLYINWPLGAKTNITWNDETKTITIVKEYLHLEPIGFVFVIFFAIIIVIQFVAMLFHRFGTLSHILASTEVSCCNAKPEELNSEAFIQRNAVEIAREFQRLKDLDGSDDLSEDSGSTERGVGRRRTIHNLEKSMKRKRRVGTLDVAFRERFFSFSADPAHMEGTPMMSRMRKLSMRRETIQAIVHRQQSVLSHDKEKMQTLGAKNSVQSNRSRHRASLPRLSTIFPNDELPNENNGISNEAFNHSSDDEDDERMSARYSAIHQENEVENM